MPAASCRDIASWISGGRSLPALTLNAGGAFLVILEVVALVGLPCLAAVFFTNLRSTAGRPPIVSPADPWN